MSSIESTYNSLMEKSSPIAIFTGLISYSGSSAAYSNDIILVICFLADGGTLQYITIIDTPMLFYADPTCFRKFQFTILQSNISIYAVCRITSYRILF